MADYYVENSELKLGVNAHGAELVSLVTKKDGREYMWSGDPAYWGRVSPVLFPFIGKLTDGSFTHNGQTYSGVPQHGYARDCDFVLSKQEGEEIWLELVSDDVWKERYPFDFCLRLGYRLEGKSVHVMWSVQNNSEETMYFSIGAHPAFVMPGMEAKNGYQIDLHTNKTILQAGVLNANGVLSDTVAEYPLENGILTVTEDLFEKDALIVDSDEIHTVALKTPDGTPFIQVRFDTPQLGIWSPVGKKAPFICIEPWYGRCDRAGFAGTLSEREYGNAIEPGHSFNKEYVIDVL